MRSVPVGRTKQGRGPSDRGPWGRRDFRIAYHRFNRSSTPPLVESPYVGQGCPIVLELEVDKRQDAVGAEGVDEDDSDAEQGALDRPWGQGEAVLGAAHI